MNKILVLLSIITLLVFGCQDITVGYLLTEDASYKPDTLVCERVADIDPDDDRINWNQPWVSTPIEGVEGTQQIFVTIKEIKEVNGGDVTEVKKQLKVYGDGTFEVALYHTIPAGRYLISLNFKNEGYSKDVNDCFTVIVK